MANRHSSLKGMLCVRHAFAWKNRAKLMANEAGYKVLVHKGIPDSLTDEGKMRASGEGRFLRTLPNCPRIWYCSPARRTTETLVRALIASFGPKNVKVEKAVAYICDAALRGPQVLAEALARYGLDFEIRFDIRLLDRYDGVRTDLTSKGFRTYFAEEIERKKAMGEEARLYYAPPGGFVPHCKLLDGKYYRPGESNYDVILRVMTLRTDIEADCAGEWVGISTHNSIIRAFVYINEGFHPAQFKEIDKLSIGNGTYWSWTTSKQGILIPQMRGHGPPMPGAEDLDLLGGRELEMAAQ